MTRRKKGATLAIGSLALVTALFVYPRSPRPRASEDRSTILEGHLSPVRALAFAPDGATLTTAAGFPNAPREEVERIAWDVRAGRPRTTHVGFQADLAALALSPDGTAMATAGGDGAARLWDVATGGSVVSLTGHQGKVQCLAFSPDGKLLASGGHDQTVRLWGVAR